MLLFGVGQLPSNLTRNLTHEPQKCINPKYVLNVLNPNPKNEGKVKM